MTVKELIKKLNQFEDDCKIMIFEENEYKTPNYVEEHDNKEVIIQYIKDYVSDV